MVEISLQIFPRKRKIKLIRQAEVAECGLACLAMVSSFYGLDVDLNVLRNRFSASLRGMSLRSIIDVADKLNLSPRPVKVDLEDLPSLKLPAILHWDMSHFVVIESISRKKALIHDPNGKTAWLNIGLVSQHFTGVALELTPSREFEPITIRQNLKISQLWSGMTGAKRALFQTLILSVLIQTFAALGPYYGQIAIDSALPDEDYDLLSTLAAAFLIVAIANMVSSLLRSSVLTSTGAVFGAGLSSNIARKLFRLPIDWFSRRQIGDILSRFQSVGPLRQMVAEDGPSSIIDGVFAAFTLCLMLFYSKTLASIAVFSFISYLVLKLLTYNSQRNAQESAIVAAGKEQSFMIESVNGIRSLRLSSAEVIRHSLWKNRMHESVNFMILNQRIINWQLSIKNFILASENILSIWISIRLIINGSFTLGMLFAFIAYKSQFLSTSFSFVDKAFSFRMLSLHLDRLSEIAFADDDLVFKNITDCTSKLCGSIELRDVSYRYGAAEPKVLNGVCFRVAPGESVAITGPSGAGKSTLANIMLGLYQPSEGEVLIDGVPLSIFGRRNYFSQVAAVLQDDALFSGSILENIAMFDENPDVTRVQKAAQIAAIHEDVMAMPMKYKTVLGGMNSSLSGGQKQRVILARAIYRSPKILIMDEATSHLDKDNENKVSNAIKQLGITCIIIAHRDETIKSADRVLVLKDGIIKG